MFSDPFYHSTLRKITSAFGSLFNDIYVRRLDSNNVEKQRIKVPLNYGPKEKYLARIIEDPDLHREIAISLPRITFQRTGMMYDADRKLNRKHKNVKTKDISTRSSQFTPVPYNVNYTVSILAKNAYDADQIIEQILPFFTPSFDITINSIPEMDIKDDMPVVLSSIREEDTYEGDYINQRALIWTLEFTVKANFYGPVRDQGIIRKVQVDIGTTPHSPITDEVVAETPREVRITIEPDPLTAGPDDDFGYSEDIEFFQDAKKYNPVTGTDEDI